MGNTDLSVAYFLNGKNKVYLPMLGLILIYPAQ
jgi:hypothetical protein